MIRQFEYIINLAEEGNTDAMVQAIQEFVWNEHLDIKMTPEIRDKVVEYLDRAIKEGNVSAMNQLGAMFAEGRMVERDPQMAFAFYEMASEAGDALATSNLGFCYYYGNGTEKNYEQAFKAFSKAASLNVMDAYIKLADMYFYGEYVKQDRETAFKMYIKAKNNAKSFLQDWGAIQVYSDACSRIGDCYAQGQGVEKDIVEASLYYGQAVYYYALREKKNDSYSHKSFIRTIEKYKKVLEELPDNIK